MLITLVGGSFIVFVLMSPPGDDITSYVAHLMAATLEGNETDEEELRERYGIGQPIYVRYAK